MQQIETFLRAASVKAVLVDQYDNTVSEKPSLVLGMAAELILHLFKTDDENDVFTAADLANYVSWVFYADNDYNHQTTPKLRIDSGITIDEDGAIHVPIDNTNTAEMAAFIGSAETKDFKAELVAFIAGSTLPDFCIQWDMSIRNRIGEEGSGQPVPVADSNYTAAQVDALFAAGNEVQYSSDGENWSSEYASGDLYRRYRNSAISGAVWTIENLATGPKGDTYYIYVGYAADAEGTDFSVTPDNSRKWKAEFHSTDIIASSDLAYSHFVSAGAVWYREIGTDGTGDMAKSDYVSAGGTGVVRMAASASAIDWSQVANKPSSFTPAAHSHKFQDISDGARQTVFATSAPTELYLNRQIIQNTSVNSNGLLNIDFSAIKDSSGGSVYNASAGDVFTWEYWMKTNTNVIQISVGSSLSIKVLDDHDLPEEIPMKGSITLHAFAIRGFYKAGASQNLQLTVNYLYSTEA